jgi:probable phosphoglycerate mutase
MTEFLLFRHGQTDWNLNHIFQGHTDIPLNQTGIEQAQFLANKIKYWKPDVIVSSDLARAVYTAEHCRLNWKVPVVTSSELREMNLGEAEGLHRDDVMKLVGPDMWIKWLGHNEEDEAFGFPGGESKMEARLRVLNFLEKFAKANPQYKRIAVSTHGGILKRVTYGLKGVPEEGVPIPNCVTYRLNFDGSNWHYVPVRERASGLVAAENKLLTFFAIDPHNSREYHFLPGGKMETGETIQECVTRETLEETGYEVSPHGHIVTSEYDFHWNNQDFWCRTHFIKADLKTDFHSPQKVTDADYNKGVQWIPAQNFASYFHYNESIFESIKKLL